MSTDPNQQRIELRDQQAEEEESLHDNQLEAMNLLLAKQNQALQTIQQQVQKASLNMGAAEAYTADEQQQIRANKALIKAQKQKIAAHQDQDATLRLKLDTQNKKHAHDVTAVERNKALLVKEQSQETLLREQLDNDASLISFLRRHENEDWKHNIAKLIHPNLLLKKGLNPKWDNDAVNQNSFYGLHLDTTHLSLPQEAETLDELKTRIERQALRCARLNSDQTRLERLAVTSKQALDALALEQTVSTQQLSNLNNKLEELEALQDSTEKNIRDQLHARKQIAAQVLQEAEQQKNDLSQQHQQAKDQIVQAHKQARDAVKAQYQRRDQQFKDELQHIEQAIQQVAQQCAQKLAELIAARDRALQAQGLDTEQLHSAEQRLIQAQQQLETVSAYIGHIHAYQKWFSVHFSQYHDLGLQLRILQDEIENLEQEQKTKARALASLDENKAKKNKQYLADIKVIQNKSLQLNKLQQRLIEPLSELSDLEQDLAMVTTEMPLDFDWYIRQGQEQLMHLEQMRTASLQLHHRVKQILSLAQGNGLERYWSHQMQDSAHRVDSLPYILEAMLVLSQMLKHEIPKKIDATIITYQSLGIVFRNHYDSLKRFQRKVARVSNDLSANINTHNPFTSLSDIEVHLEATINKFGYLTDLENFVHKFEADSNELPNENLVTALEGAIKALHNANAESHDLRSMVEMSIRFRENMRLVRVRNDHDLSEGSSTGLSRLVILLIFTGLIRHLCADESVAIHLPIDELGQIDASNSIKLLALMQQQQVHLMCAQPQMSEEIGKSFAYKFHIDKDKGVSQFVIKAKAQNNPLLVVGSNS